MITVRSRPFGLHYGYIALAMGAVAIMGTLGFGRWGYSLILPGMREGLSLSYTQMGILGTANMLGYLAAVPLGGIAASRYGSRLVIGASVLVTGVALLGTGLSPGFEPALILQTLAGVASAGAIVPSMALAGIWVAPRKRGLATGLVNTGLGESGTFLSSTGSLVSPSPYSQPSSRPSCETRAGLPKASLGICGRYPAWG